MVKILVWKGNLNQVEILNLSYYVTQLGHRYSLGNKICKNILTYLYKSHVTGKERVILIRMSIN